MPTSGVATPKSVRLDPVAADQASELGAYCRQIYGQHYEHLWLEGGSAWYQQEVYGDAVLASELRDGDVRHYFIESGDGRVGFLRLNPGLDLPGMPRGFELSRLYFSRQSTGQGAGQQVLDAVTDLARAMEREYLWLHVMDSSEGAIRFYRRAGFQAVGETLLPFALIRPGFRRMLQMRKDL